MGTLMRCPHWIRSNSGLAPHPLNNTNEKTCKYIDIYSILHFIYPKCNVLGCQYWQNFDSPSQEALYQHLLKGYTVGTADQCKAEIEVLAEAFGVEEVAVVTVTHDFTARLESYRLLQ